MRKCAGLFFGTWLVVGAVAMGQSPPAATQPTTQMSLELLQQLQAKLKDVNTVEADFVQEKKMAMLNHTLVIRGHFAMTKPDRFVWITTDPVKSAIKVEGEEVQQWDEDTNRVDVIHLGGDPTFKAVSQQIQAWFLGDYAALGAGYEVNVVNEKPLTLAFGPKDQSSVGKIINHVQITFADDERYIQQMIIEEASGSETTLKFINAQVNQPIKDDVWRIPPNEH